MAGWADLWYAHPYFVGHFWSDLADKRPVGSGHYREHNDSVGNNSVVAVQRHLSRSWRLGHAGVLVAVDWKERATCISLAAGPVRDQPS